MSTVMNSVTDLVMAAQCGVAWGRLRSGGPAAQPWARFFASLACASVAGSVRHAAPDGTPTVAGAMLLLDIAIGAMVVSAQSATLAWRPPGSRQLLRDLFLVQLGAFGVAAASRHDFMPAFTNAVIGLGWVMGASIVAAGTGRRGAADVARGLLMGVGAALVYLSRRGPASWFDHVDVAHTIVIVALILLHKGASQDVIEASHPPLWCPDGLPSGPPVGSVRQEAHR